MSQSNCKLCGDAFEPHHTNHQFCSPICRETFWSSGGSNETAAANARKDLFKNIVLCDGPLVTPCWEWQGSGTNCGYGRIRFQGYCYSVHRLSWIANNGPIPDGLHVLHRCDQPPCINPEHLFLGTPKDNTGDCIAKGRFTPKKIQILSDVDVANIKGLLLRPPWRGQQAEIARRYYVNSAVISNIARGRNSANIAPSPNPVMPPPAPVLPPPPPVMPPPASPFAPLLRRAL
jgi:HNH endonuclease